MVGVVRDRQAIAHRSRAYAQVNRLLPLALASALAMFTAFLTASHERLLPGRWRVSPSLIGSAGGAK